MDEDLQIMRQANKEMSFNHLLSVLGTTREALFRRARQLGVEPWIRPKVEPKRNEFVFGTKTFETIQFMQAIDRAEANMTPEDEYPPIDYHSEDRTYDPYKGGSAMELKRLETYHQGRQYEEVKLKARKTA